MAEVIPEYKEPDSGLCTYTHIPPLTSISTAAESFAGYDKIDFFRKIINSLFYRASGKKFMEEQKGHWQGPFVYTFVCIVTPA